MGISTKQTLINKIENAHGSLSSWRIKIEEAIDIAYGSAIKFKVGGRDARREVLFNIGSNLQVNHKKVLIELDDHLIPFAEQEKWSEKYKDWVEPQRYTDLFAQFPDLRPANPIWLGDRNVNITSQFVRIFKVFENFRFINQLKEEMEKVRPAMAIVS